MKKVVHHNLIEFIPKILGWLNSWTLIQIICDLSHSGA